MCTVVGSRERVPTCPACGADRSRPFTTTSAMMDEGDETFTFVECLGCEAVYLSPRVPAAELGRYYPPSYLPWRGPEGWGRYRGLVAAGLRGTDRRRVRRVQRHCAVGPATRVLDVGCGNPTFLRALADASGCVAVGTDVSDEGWRALGSRYRDLELRTGDLAQMQFSEPFDLLTMWHYLEHDYAPIQTLQRVRELARPGGCLVIEVPDHGSWSRRRYGAEWAGYHTPRHTVLWTRETLRGVLERSGWIVDTVEQTGTLDPWTLAWMSRGERKGIDWAGSMEPHFPGFLFGRVVLWPLIRSWEWARGHRGAGLLTAVARVPV